jgi:hypothetical protein
MQCEDTGLTAGLKLGFNDRVRRVHARNKIAQIFSDAGTKMILMHLIRRTHFRSPAIKVVQLNTKTARLASLRANFGISHLL